MSDHDDVPELSPEARAFLARHEATGEPSAQGLERGRQRLAWLSRGATPAVPARRPVRTRSWLPPEVTAAAAVVIVLLGAQLLYLLVRTPAVTVESSAEVKPVVKPVVVAAPSGDREVKAIAEAWTAGDLEGAKRLASQDCRSSACGSLASELAVALGLAARIDELSDEELDQLDDFDAKLAGDADSSVERRRKRVVMAPPSTAALAEAAQLFREASDDDSSPVRRPDLPGMNFTIPVGGTRLLTLAPDVARIAVGAPVVADVSVTGPGKLLLTGVGPGKTTLLVWFTDGRRQNMFVEVVGRTLRARDLYLRAYQLRDSAPEEAIRLFKEVMELTPPDDANHQKAKSRVNELEADRP